jgi:hypothetical protein
MRKQSSALSYSLSLSLSPVAPTLENRASVKRFLHFSFLTLTQSVGLLGRGGSPLRKATTYDKNTE